MTGGEQRLVIGLPVRNGEAYLARQLDSLLAQDFEDFELIISDNASSDATPEICRRYAAADSRITYLRSDVDRGLVWNWNHVFEFSRAPYFKWAAHDDEHAPSFLSRCVAVLDADPSVVCCHTATVEIDEHGAAVREWPARTRPASSSAHVRFGDVLRPYPCFQVFGVIRAEALARTGLHRPFPESDHALLAELALMGRLVEVPEPLFRRRDHRARSVRAFPSQRQRWNLYTGRPSPRVGLAGLRLSLRIVHVLRRSDVTGRERLLCYLALRHWVARELRRGVGTALRGGLRMIGREDASPFVGDPARLLQELRSGRRAAGEARAEPPSSRE
jgi:glycosyltransferase involved in cell wall biosynthesis